MWGEFFGAVWGGVVSAFLFVLHLVPHLLFFAALVVILGGSISVLDEAADRGVGAWIVVLVLVPAMYLCGWLIYLYLKFIHGIDIRSL